MSKEVKMICVYNKDYEDYLVIGKWYNLNSDVNNPDFYILLGENAKILTFNNLTMPLYFKTGLGKILREQYMIGFNDGLRNQNKEI